MNAFWSYFWPAATAGLIVGLIAGAIGFRYQSRRIAAFAIGTIASLGLAGLWHGPLGAGDRFAVEVERSVRWATVYYEIPEVTGHVHRGPLTRQVLLSGPADDFQRSELVRIIGDLPGVSAATWSADAGGVPLIVEGGAAAILGFLVGLLLAYFRELRRRYNTQWNW